MLIEIMGSGCRNCEQLYQNAQEAVENAGLSGQVDITKIKDPNEFISRGVFTTPGLAIGGRVVSTGQVLASEKIGELIAEVMAEKAETD